MVGLVNCRISSRTLATTQLMLFVVLSACCTTKVCHADDIVFGMSTALTGPAAELGLNMRAGVEAAFQEVNASGGIRGHELRLIAMDDGYEPAKTAPNTRVLISEHSVLAVVGNVGTPTAVVAVPIAVEHKTLFFGAFTGAGVLRTNPPERYVINYRASYAEETGAMVDALIDKLNLAVDEIAFFTQRDAYGDAGYVGGIDALRRHGLKSEAQISHGRYERNTDAVENAVAELLMATPTPRAIIMVGAYRPCAEFIRLAKSSGLNAIFLNVSFVGASPLLKELGRHGDGVVVTQVVPHYSSSDKIVKQYRDALAVYDNRLPHSFGSLEGYISARVLIKGLEGIRGEITRESIITSLDSLGVFEVGLDKPLHLSSKDHQASHRVWPTVLNDGWVQPLDWESIRLKGDGE